MKRGPATVFIIAEAGVNHNGSLDLARELIDVAQAAGVNAVKFQSFNAGRLVSKFSPKADYQIRTTGVGESQLEMLKRLELDESAHDVLIRHCQERKLEFLSSPFDLESVDLLCGRFGLRRLKIPSGQITNGPLLLRAAQTDASLVISTGMSSLGEVEAALQVVAFGYCDKEKQPSREHFEAAFLRPRARDLLREKVTLLHCTTEYPAPFAEVNLRAMDTLAHAFGVDVGFSDHTPGIAMPLAAVARGATVVEKHFTLDRNLPGPDHLASLEPIELTAMVRGIREIEAALGDSMKMPVPSEFANRGVARQSLVAKLPIQTGDRFTASNIAIKRPGTGISPMRYWDVLGKVATREYELDEALEE